MKHFSMSRNTHTVNINASSKEEAFNTLVAFEEKEYGKRIVTLDATVDDMSEGSEINTAVTYHSNTHHSHP